MIENRIAVTGIGLISALGIGAEQNLHALRNKYCGIAPVRYLSTSLRDIPVGEVDATNEELASKLGISYPGSELRSVLLGVAAAREAMQSAMLTESDLTETAFINGITVGGMDKTEQHFPTVYQANGQHSEIGELVYNDCGVISELIADHIGSPAFVSTISTACSSAANAIILGAELLESGMYQRVIVGGTEALSRFHLNGFNSLMILDREICRPFSPDRAGINLGEGAAYLVMEREDRARERRVSPMAYLIGRGNRCDAYHQTASSENGEGAYLAMMSAFKMANIHHSEIGYINAHGTGTQNNDASELAALKRIWGDNLPIFSSTKSLTGHTTSASGALESALTILAVNNRFLPNSDSSGETRVEYFLNNAFGFGGNDTSLIFQMSVDE